jgi:mitochondrial inner membrane protein COX18
MLNLVSMKSFYASGHSRNLLRNTFKPLSQGQTLSFARRFHAPPPNFTEPTSSSPDLIDQALQFSHGVFENVHAFTGLPWALSIPLVAILFRLAYSPVQYILNRDQRDAAIHVPLMVAWRDSLRKQAKLKFRPSNPRNLRLAEQWTEQQLKLKRNDAGTFSKPRTIKHILLSLGFLPIWIVNMDTIRRMAGVETTLLATLRGTGEKLDNSIVLPEPSLAVEGMLWFPDLTMADPTMILPISFGIASLANWWSATGKRDRERGQVIKNAESLTDQKKAAIRGQLFSSVIFCLSLCAGPILIANEVPSGVCLYLTASAMTMLVQRPVMKRMMGLKEQIKMARPLLPRMKF